MPVSPVINSTLNKLVDATIPPEVVSFLNVNLFQTQLLFLNRWSWIHLLSGFIFFKFFPDKFKLWIKLNILFEIIEFILGFSLNHPLFVEEGIDIAFDIFLSLMGFKLAERLFKKEKN